MFITLLHHFSQQNSGFFVGANGSDTQHFRAHVFVLTALQQPPNLPKNLFFAEVWHPEQAVTRRIDYLRLVIGEW
jgi:hypothetical protein